MCVTLWGWLGATDVDSERTGARRVRGHGAENGRKPSSDRGTDGVMRVSPSVAARQNRRPRDRRRMALTLALSPLMAVLVGLVPALTGAGLALAAGKEPVPAKEQGQKDQAQKEQGAGRDASPPKDTVLRDIVETGVETQQQALASQQRIDKAAQEAAELAARYKSVLKEIDGLKSYNAQLERQLANQRAEMAALAGSADRVVEMERQLVPLMNRMVESLGQFIDLDLPFRHAERRAVVARLRALLERADAPVSEKFRAVIAAYEAETSYSRAFTTYDGSLPVNGKVQPVHFLQVGRLAFLFQTRDGTTSGLWNPQTRQWDLLDPRFGRGIAEGVRVARHEVTAERLLPIPLRVPATARPTEGKR